jgi:hypothetical protein
MLIFKVTQVVLNSGRALNDKDEGKEALFYGAIPA